MKKVILEQRGVKLLVIFQGLEDLNQEVLEIMFWGLEELMGEVKL